MYMQAINLLLINVEAITKNSIVIAILGYSIVFIALVLLYMVFYYMPKILNKSEKQKIMREQKISAEEAEKAMNISVEVNAAIGMGIFMYYNEYHDEDNNILTIKRVSKVYSPWSSKIYSVRNAFNRI